jgi:5-methylcytosine-specific restriction endonuclease McrA
MKSLFINGIFESVLLEILDAQIGLGGGEFFIHPHSGRMIVMLRANQPTPEKPIKLYLSTTKQLSQICYVAEIIRYEDKRILSDTRRAEVQKHLEEFQPGEVSFFVGEEEGGDKAVNLITIRDLRKLETSYSTSLLRKVSDELPLKKRTRAGSWSEVYDLGGLMDFPTETQERFDRSFITGIKESTESSDQAIEERLASAQRQPEKVQVISVAYRRNPDVVVSVLRRAGGRCEECGKEGPFRRKSDNSPFLEVHHKVLLSQGGEDTTDNAMALCPNCHRKLHFG